MAAKAQTTRTPVRIYVLWDPAYKEGLIIARAIYHWFRLPTSEGIPVYFRRSRKIEIPDQSCDWNIVVPLVDPNMVASLSWRSWIEELTMRAERKARSNSAKAKYRVLPIALHSTAYQMPSMVRKLNFIRQVEAESGRNWEALLAKLTESICLLLQRERDPTGLQPIKIFLSHAKADGTEVPKQIKQYIQSETQCQTFFDENDIAYGDDFSDVIERALKTESAGLLIVQGDHYANRPWCRKEIRDYLKPHLVEEVGAGKEGGVVARVFSVMPSVLVANFQGRQDARTIPELGHSTCIPWSELAARRAVVTMLREILLANFYRLLAHSAAEGVREGAAQARPRGSGKQPKRDEPLRLFVNQPPDPVMIEQMLNMVDEEGAAQDGTAIRRRDRRAILYHPGHGLSGVELEGLRMIYGKSIDFRSFGDPDPEESAAEAAKPERRRFDERVLALSVGNSSDILDAGFGDEHTVELLRRILRPLFKEGISLLYGGKLPDWQAPEPPETAQINFTEVFLELLLAEREASEGIESDSRGKGRSARPFAQRLFNLSAWPASESFGIEEQAQWINTCSFHKITQKEAGIPERLRIAEGGGARPSERSRRRNTAHCLSVMRRRAAGTVRCHFPGRPDFEFEALAQVFLGGKLEGYSGIIPGVWEEILYALENRRPCFVIGAARGAAGLFADWLANPAALEERPAELRQEALLRDLEKRNRARLLSDDLKTLEGAVTAEEALDRIWNLLRNANLGDLPSLLRNGLDHEQNLVLLRTQDADFRRIALLVHEGLRRLVDGERSEGRGEEH